MGNIPSARLIVSMCFVTILGVVGLAPGTAGATPSTPSLAACKALRSASTWRNQSTLAATLAECLAAINADLPTTDNGGRSWR